jgi:hypothetical protein
VGAQQPQFTHIRSACEGGDSAWAPAVPGRGRESQRDQQAMVWLALVQEKGPEGSPAPATSLGVLSHSLCFSIFYDCKHNCLVGCGGHICDPSTWEVRVQVQPGLHRQTLSQKK